MHPYSLGYIEGYLATTRPGRDGRAFSVEELLALWRRLQERPWLQGSEGEEPLGRVTRCEVRPLSGGHGLWARVELYQRAALTLTAQGMLPLLGLAETEGLPATPQPLPTPPLP